MILDQSRHTSPEQLLSRAVIAQAVIDLFSATIACSTQEEVMLARLAALNFLTDADGAWAEARRAHCMVADHDPDEIRARTVAILNGARLNDDGHGFRLAGVEVARELWVQERERQRAYFAKAREKVKQRKASRWAEQLREQDRRIKDQRIVEQRAREPEQWRGLDRRIATHSELVDDVAAYIDIEL